MGCLTVPVTHSSEDEESALSSTPREQFFSIDLESGLAGTAFLQEEDKSVAPDRDSQPIPRIHVTCSTSVPIPAPLATFRGRDLGPRVDINFRGVGFTARTKTGGRLQILRHASGTCKSGRLMAIAGPSGAGKVSYILPSVAIALQREKNRTRESLKFV